MPSALQAAYEAIYPVDYVSSETGAGLDDRRDGIDRDALGHPVAEFALVPDRDMAGARGVAIAALEALRAVPEPRPLVA